MQLFDGLDEDLAVAAVAAGVQIGNAKDPGFQIPGPSQEAKLQHFGEARLTAIG